MKTLLKVVLGLVVVVVVLVGAAAVLLPQFIDAEDLKAQAIARVKEQTGRDLHIPGDVSLSVFPTLGLDVGEVALGNAPGFDGDTFASIDRLTVRLQLMPLLSREVVMDTVVLHGLDVNLARNAEGTGNWEDLAAGGAGETGGTGGADGAPAGGDGAGLAALSVGGVDVRDASLSFADRQAGQTWELDNLAVQTGPVTLGQPVELEIAFDIAGGAPAVQGRVEIAGTVAADPAAQRYDVDGLTVTADLAGDTLPGGRVTATLGADVSADLGAQTLAVDGLGLETMGLTASGELGVTKLLAAEPAFEGKLSLATFNPRDLIAALGAAAPQTADESALTSAEASFGLAGTPKAVTLEPLKLRLDDTTFSGRFAVADVATQALRFELQGDAIDVDRYLPPPAAEGTAGAPAGGGGGGDGGAAAPAGAEPDLAALRTLDVDGRVALGRLKIMNLSVTDISVPVKAKDGVLRLSPMAAKLYDGSYAGNVTLDARGQAPKIAVDEKLAGVQAGPLLDDLQQGEGKLEGTADVTAKLGFTGTQPEAVKRSLNGDVGFSFTDGAIRGINIAQVIRSALATLRGGTEDADAPRRTDFASLSGTARIADGVVRNDDLALKSSLLRVQGQGTADLPGDTVDYRVTTTLVATSQGQGGKELEQLSGVPVPVRVSGSLAAPSFRPDMEALAAAVAKSKAGEVIEQQKAQAQEKLKESLGGALGGALGGGGTSGDAAPAEGGSDPAGDAVNKLKGLFGN